MNTFEEAQAEALKARQAIDKLEALKAEKSQELADKREHFAAYELDAIDRVQKLDSEIGEARRELQTALQRQNDAPLQADAAPAAEVSTAAIVADGFRVNPFNGATERFGTVAGATLERQAYSGEGYGDGNT
jgi:hypothetical protein